jgi:serine/threonine-protein kinase
MSLAVARRSVAIGDVLEGRYRIVAKLAEGGMGTVYLAQHTRIKRRLAIKVLRAELAGELGIVRRFMNEALAAGTLGHPNIVEATDMGFCGQLPFIVFEYLEGALLTEEIYRVDGLPARRAIDIALQIASALEAAHAAGVIHLDLKTDNIFLTDRGETSDHVKVLDFGIARFMATDIERTQPMVVGTPEFMAPEQITAPETVDHRTDVYALGACLYEMLMARTPFSGEDLRVLLHRVVNEPPPPLDDDVPAELGDAVMRMLAKRPSDRYTSMRAVIEDLRAIAQDLKDVVLLTPAMRKDEPYSELVLKLG